MVEQLHDLGEGPSLRDRTRGAGRSVRAASPRCCRTRPWVPYLYVAPAFALLALVFAYPVVRVVDFSTRLIRGASGPYVGSLNYQLVLGGPDLPRRRSSTAHSCCSPFPC